MHSNITVEMTCSNNFDPPMRACGRVPRPKSRLLRGAPGRALVAAWSLGVGILLVQLRILLPFRASGSEGIAVLAASELHVVAAALDPSAGQLWSKATTLANLNATAPYDASGVSSAGHAPHEARSRFEQEAGPFKEETLAGLAGVPVSYGSPNNLTGLKGKLRIAIVVTSDDAYAAKFQWHTESVRCYAEQHGYGYVRVPSRDMHQRHSVVLNSMEHFDWLLFLDGDSMVLNHAT